jgi:hypothetical protein
MHGGAFCTRDTQQPGTSENQRQGETEVETSDDEGDGDDNESRRCSDSVYEYFSKYRDDQRNVVKFYATELLMNLDAY